MSDSRPKCNIATPQDKCFDGSASIESQSGFYGQKSQPGVGDVNSRAGQLPAAPDDRLTNVFTPKD